MLSKPFFMAFLALATVSCKTNKEEPLEQDEQTVSNDATTVSTLETGCYTFKRAGTLINFEITKNQNPVEGTLMYAISGKDKNTGAFRGKLVDDKLVGMYTFMSEGVQSERQVAFLLKGKRLVEGDGQLNDEGNRFNDLNTVSYSSETPLNKADCTR